MSYNAYVIADEKTALIDTVDHVIDERMLENIEHVLAGRKLDYIFVQHMEPDHSASLKKAMETYPEAVIVGSAKTLGMIGQYFGTDVSGRYQTVKEGETLSTGKHELTFVMAPMVHWPEVMVTFDKTCGILFAADAFGSFGALNGNIFADEVDFERDWLDDARSYYVNIVGKYGGQVQNLLKKAAGLEIRMICPLHGPIWRENIGWFVNKYDLWSKYQPEEKGVVIAYGSVYGHTENAAEIIAARLADRGVRNIKMYDVSATHPSQIVSDCFKYSHLIFASITYNAGIFINMETLLLDLKAHALQKRKVALVENGTWAPASGKQMTELIGSMKDMEIIAPTLTLKSALRADQVETAVALADAVADSLAE